MYGSTAAAAKKRREQQEEEQEKTGYKQEVIEGWEFKIVRSMFGRFTSPENLKRVCEEEARAGWEMLEKFDNSRIRFKRRVEKRHTDPTLGYDAYRTTYGMGEGTLALTIVTIIALVVLTILLLTP
jgi:hypothetical protein